MALDSGTAAGGHPDAADGGRRRSALHSTGRLPVTVAELTACADDSVGVGRLALTVNRAIDLEMTHQLSESGDRLVRRLDDGHGPQIGSLVTARADIFAVVAAGLRADLPGGASSAGHP